MQNNRYEVDLDTILESLERVYQDAQQMIELRNHDIPSEYAKYRDIVYRKVSNAFSKSAVPEELSDELVFSLLDLVTGHRYHLTELAVDFHVKKEGTKYKKIPACIQISGMECLQREFVIDGKKVWCRNSVGQSDGTNKNVPKIKFVLEEEMKTDPNADQ